MELKDLLAAHAQRKRPTCPHHLRDKEYRTHYPLVKQAVEHGIPLLAAIKLLRSHDGAFTGREDKTVWAAYSRSFKKEEKINNSLN